MQLNSLLVVCFLFLLAPVLQAQPFFPVKVAQRWGLIDSDGQLVLEPVYEAIGEFEHFGYAVMQKAGYVGLLGPDGKEAIAAKYDDIKVLGTDLIAVLEGENWRVINASGSTVLGEAYERIKVLLPGVLAYRKNKYWGIVNAQGLRLAEPQYEQVSLWEDRFFLVEQGGKQGVLNLEGKSVLDPIAGALSLYNDSLLFFRQARKWGAVSMAGELKIAAAYDSFRALGPHFIKLLQGDKIEIYSPACGAVLRLRAADDYYPFSARYLISKKNRRLGLISWCGQEILPPTFHEIQAFADGLFRVNKHGQWGVVDLNNTMLIPAVYQYISPLQGPVCMVQQGGQFGVLNHRGDTLVPPVFSRIELEAGQAKAYRLTEQGAEELRLFFFDRQGTLTENRAFSQHFQVKIGSLQANTTTEGLPAAPNAYQLQHFEWFYAPATDRWGLRNINNGQIQIEPTFDYIEVYPDLGYTLVGIWKSNDYEFERTSFRFDMIFGLVLNELGIPVTEINFLDVRLEDFARGHPNCRVIFADGRHGLLDRSGRLNRTDLTYVGDFHDGVARVSFVGKLSGKRQARQHLGPLREYLAKIQSPHYMLDYTQYDQLFQEEAMLVCEDCEWGYIDSTGQVVVKPSYSFAEDMVNGAGFVACGDKWGMVDKQGMERISCAYDGIEFLERTGNRMIRVYVHQPKYGLIDTLGQLAVNAVYEEIGSFAEGRLAVKRDGRWGYVDREGQELIPCQFAEVRNFSEGLAAVRRDKNWGFIDLQGKEVIAFHFEKLGDFQDGLAWAKQDKRVGYIDSTAQFIISPAFEQAHNFERGIARVKIEGKYGLIDRFGKFVLPPRYVHIEAFDEYGLAVVQVSSEPARYSLINRMGQRIMTAEYRRIDRFHEGLARVQGKQGFGYLNTNGKLAIPCRFNRASDFHEGRAIVYQKGRCGYIDLRGEVVIPCQFSRCQNFKEGKAVVYEGIRNAGLVDPYGEFIVKPSLDRLLTFQEGRGLMRDDNYRFYYITEQTQLYDGYYQQASAFQHGVAVVQIDGRWGIINQKGIEIIPPKYDHIESFHNGYAKVKIKGYNGLINLAGEFIVRPNYEFIQYAGEGLFRVEQGDKVGYFDSDGRWVWNLTN